MKKSHILILMECNSSSTYFIISLYTPIYFSYKPFHTYILVPISKF